MANLETTQELNKLLKEQNKLLAAQAKIMKSQASTMKAMMTSMQKMPVEDVNRAFSEMNSAIQDADKALEDFGGEQQKAFEDMTAGAEEAAEQMETLTEQIKNTAVGGAAIATVSTALAGLNAGTRAAVGVFGSMVSIASTLTTSMFSLASSIIAIPFKMMGALMEEAARGGGTEFRQAIADLRKEMGTLAENEGKAVMQSFRNMRHEGVETGLSTYRVFGNMAERLKFVTEMAQSLGRTFNQFADELAENGARLGSYKKGLGLSEEAMGSLAKRASASGKSLSEMGREMTTMAYGMGEAFGINGKLISRDMAEMAGDFENFGSVGQKTMASVAVFTRKLGIEVKDLLGLISKFDNFEDAAGSAAQLSQAFGMQVDALKMMKEQDPAARFETMRKSFHATGKSIENLNRQELSLLSSQSGISAEALKIGFAQGKQNMSYKDVQKESEKTEKKQLSQAEAMAKLSDSIELMVKSGAEMKGGFFDIFISGFQRGLRIAAPVRLMFRTIRRAMRTTRLAGIEVGRMFVDNFPGFLPIVEGLTEAFKNFGSMFRSQGLHMTGFIAEVVTSFRKFFDVLTKDPKSSLKVLFENLKENFFDLFDKNSGPGKKVLSGFNTFFVTMGKVFAGGIELAMEGAVEGFKFLTELLVDPSAAMGGLSKAQSGVSKFFVDVFSPAWDVLKAQWPKLKEALVGLWDQAVISLGLEKKFEEFKGMLISGVTKMAMGAMFSRLLISGTMFAFSAVASAVTKKGSDMIGIALNKSFKKAAVSPKAASGMKALGDAAGAVGPAGAKTSMSAKMLQSAKFGAKAAGYVVLGIVALGLVAAAIAKSFPIFSDMIGKVKEGEIAKVAGVMGTMIAVYAGTALLMAGAAGVGALMAFGGGVGALAMVAGIAAIATVATGMVEHAILLVTAVNQMPAPAGLERKVDIFTSVLGAMASLGSVMSDMAKNSSSVFLNVKAMFTGGNPIVDGIEALGKIMGQMSVHVKEIIDQIATVTRGISPDQIKAGEMIGTVLQAIGSLMQTMMPPEELMPGPVDRYMEAVGAAPDSLNQVSGYMTGVIATMKDTVIPAVIGSMTTINNMPKIDKAKLGMFSSFLSSLSSLMKAFTPPAALIEALTNTREKSSMWGMFGEDSVDVGEMLKPVTKFMKGMIDSLFGPDGAMKSIQKFMKTMVGETKSLGSPEELNAAATLLGAVMDAMGKVSEIFSPDKMSQFDKAGKQAGVIPGLGGTFTEYFMAIKSDIAEVKKHFVGDVSTGIKDMITEINGITDGLSNFKVPAIKTQLKQTADKLGLAGSGEYKIKIKDINLHIEVGVTLDADGLEKALINRPGKSSFMIKGGSGT